MKELFVVFSFAFFLLACERDNSISESDIPDWLKNKIAESEEIIESDPNSVAAITAWLRFKYDGDYYYEFDNSLSSAYREVYTSDGTPLIPQIPLFLIISLKNVAGNMSGKDPHILRSEFTGLTSTVK